MKAAYTRYILDFKVPGGTSRGILTQKETGLSVYGMMKHLGYSELESVLCFEG